MSNDIGKKKTNKIEKTLYILGVIVITVLLIYCNLTIHVDNKHYYVFIGDVQIGYSGQYSRVTKDGKAIISKNTKVKVAK